MENNIYIICQPTGSYEDYRVSVEGYCTSEEDAKKICEKINNRINTPSPLKQEYEEIYGEVDYEWEEIEYKMCKENPYYDESVIPHVTDSKKYGEWIDALNKRVREKLKPEFFASKGIDYILPEGMSWKEFFDLLEETTMYQQWEYGDAYYEKIDKLVP